MRDGNVDLTDLTAEGRGCMPRISPALMITYPSTHGVFEHGIREACAHRSTPTVDWCTWMART